MICFPPWCFITCHKASPLSLSLQLISALFPSADGALTALTSSFCIDLLDLKKPSPAWEKQQKKKDPHDGAYQFCHTPSFVASFFSNGSITNRLSMLFLISQAIHMDPYWVCLHSGSLRNDNCPIPGGSRPPACSHLPVVISSASMLRNGLAASRSVLNYC